MKKIVISIAVCTLLLAQDRDFERGLYAIVEELGQERKETSRMLQRKIGILKYANQVSADGKGTRAYVEERIERLQKIPISLDEIGRRLIPARAIRNYSHAYNKLVSHVKVTDLLFNVFREFSSDYSSVGSLTTVVNPIIDLQEKTHQVLKQDARLQKEVFDLQTKLTENPTKQVLAAYKRTTVQVLIELLTVMVEQEIMIITIQSSIKQKALEA